MDEKPPLQPLRLWKEVTARSVDADVTGLKETSAGEDLAPSAAIFEAVRERELFELLPSLLAEHDMDGEVLAAAR
jgi:hypothetical protein